MLLKEFFENLSYGELSNLSIGNAGEGWIDYQHHQKLARFVENGLKAIYSRFTHKRGYVKIRLTVGTGSYEITSDHAVSNEDVSNLKPRYILDSVNDPYRGDLLKIIEAVIQDDPNTAVNETEVMKINTTNKRGIQITGKNTIRVEGAKEGEIVELEYRAMHEPISRDLNIDQEIVLHSILETALEKYVASMVYGTMNGEENTTRKLMLMQEYEQICRMVTQEDLLSESHTGSHDRLRDKGFI